MEASLAAQFHKEIALVEKVRGVLLAGRPLDSGTGLQLVRVLDRWRGELSMHRQEPDPPPAPPVVAPPVPPAPSPSRGPAALADQIIADAHRQENPQA